MQAYRWVLTSATWFVPNNSRFEGLKSSGALAIVESDTLLSLMLTYYERTTVNLINNSKGYAEVKNQFTLPWLTERLDPHETNWVAVMQQRPMQNVLRRGEMGQIVLRLNHGTTQEARQLRRAVDARLAE